MAVISSPLLQIESFNQRILRTGPNLGAIEAAKQVFQDLLRFSDDPACQKALSEAKVLLAVKEEQAITASKVERALHSWKELEASVPKASGETYAALKQEILALKTAIEDLREDVFPADVSKRGIVSKLEVFEHFVESKNPSAWKLRAKIQAGIALGMGAFFAFAPRILEGAFTAFDDLARSQLNSSLCDRQLLAIDPPLCTDSISLSTQASVGLLFGIGGVLTAMALSKVRQSAIPLLTKTYAWAYSYLPPNEPAAPQSRPKTIDVALAPFSVDSVSLKPLSPSKQFAYDKLTQGVAPADPLQFSIHHLAKRDEVLQCKVFQRPKPPVVETSGAFAFPPSTDKVEHWTVDFANPHLLGSIEGPLLGQEELLALEHPALFHLKALLDRTPHIHPLAENRIALITHVRRYGALKGLDSDAFLTASQELIDEKLERLNEPVFSNLFAMATQKNPEKAGKPYQKTDLKELFLRAATAFSAIAGRKGATQVSAVVHTGHWGAPLAAALTQILAARAAGIELHFYPFGETEAFQEAQSILANIERQKPEACIGEILLYLANNAAKYGIVYA